MASVDSCWKVSFWLPQSNGHESRSPSILHDDTNLAGYLPVPSDERRRGSCSAGASLHAKAAVKSATRIPPQDHRFSFSQICAMPAARSFAPAA